MIRDWQLLHNVGQQLATSRDWPNWSSESEFRATRDQSAGERGGSAPAAPTDQPPASDGERG
ncbi:MAG TPA: hypothetical protein VKA61_13655 [Sphingomicrobium sp.]|nr:hypothetical protein [Sphingomicrobium sp.]